MIYRKTKKNHYITIDGEGKSRFISRDKIPVNILMELDKTSEVKFEGCVFCGQDGPRKRLVNGVVVALCDEHYYSQTLGSIVAKLRERNNDGIRKTTPVRSPA